MCGRTRPRFCFVLFFCVLWITSHPNCTFAFVSVRLESLTAVLCTSYRRISPISPILSINIIISETRRGCMAKDAKFRRDTLFINLTNQSYRVSTWSLLRVVKYIRLNLAAFYI